MRHEHICGDITVGGRTYHYYYNDTYPDKTIKELCSINNLEFWSIEDAVNLISNDRGFVGVSSMLNRQFKFVSCKDGIWAVKAYTTFYPKKKYVYKPKPYYVPAEGEVLGKDMFGNPLHAGDTIIYTKNNKLWFLQIITKTPTMLKVNVVDNPRRYPFNIVKHPNRIAKYTKIG
jgi:hypothetical protein